MTDKIIKKPEEWKEHLTPEQYEICINHGTEPPFSGKYNNSKLRGGFQVHMLWGGAFFIRCKI